MPTLCFCSGTERISFCNLSSRACLAVYSETLKTSAFLKIDKSQKTIVKSWIISPLSSVIRSSHPEMFCGKGVMKICIKFTGENLLHIFRTPFPKNNSDGLHLSDSKFFFDPLREKCPNTEFFPVRIFPHLDRIRRDILRIYPYLVQMRENTDQKKLRIWTLFTQWSAQPINSSFRHSVLYPSVGSSSAILMAFVILLIFLFPVWRVRSGLTLLEKSNQTVTKIYRLDRVHFGLWFRLSSLSLVEAATLSLTLLKILVVPEHRK